MKEKIAEDEHIYLKSFMPEAALLRISSPYYWNFWVTTNSIKAAGKDRKGTEVSVFAHLENYFGDIENLRKSIKNGLNDGAGIIPKEEFYRLIDLDGYKDMMNIRRVFVFDNKNLKNYREEMHLDNVLEQPITEAFFGSRTIAKEYLKSAHKNASRYNHTSYIGIWNEKISYDLPHARMLKLGFNPRTGIDCNGILNHLPYHELNTWRDKNE